MRFRVYHTGEVIGPIEGAELQTLDWFHADVLVCPENCHGVNAGDWVRAAEVLELFPSAPDKASAVARGEPGSGIPAIVTIPQRVADMEDTLESLGSRLEEMGTQLGGRIADDIGRMEQVQKEQKALVEEIRFNIADLGRRLDRSDGDVAKSLSEAQRLERDLAASQDAWRCESGNLSASIKGLQETINSLEESLKAALNWAAPLKKIEEKFTSHAGFLAKIQKLLSDHDKTLAALGQKVTTLVSKPPVYVPAPRASPLPQTPPSPTPMPAQRQGTPSPAHALRGKVRWIAIGAGASLLLGGIIWMLERKSAAPNKALKPSAVSPAVSQNPAVSQAPVPGNSQSSKAAEAKIPAVPPTEPPLALKDDLRKAAIEAILETASSPQKKQTEKSSSPTSESPRETPPSLPGLEEKRSEASAATAKPKEKAGSQAPATDSGSGFFE